MENNFNGLLRMYDVTNVTNTNLPKGWVVRERCTEEGKGISLDLGCYLTDEIFISVPIHFSVKKSLIPIPTTKSANDSEYFKYYSVPKEMRFAVSTYKNKNGQDRPIIILPNEKYRPVHIACLATDCGAESILNVTINEFIKGRTNDDGVKVIRKYIDRNRKSLGLIMFYTNPNIINPSIKVSIDYGVLGQHAMTTVKYTFDNLTVNTTTDTENVNDPLTTKFIDLPAFTDKFTVNKSSTDVKKEHKHVAKKTDQDNSKE